MTGRKSGGRRRWVIIVGAVVVALVVWVPLGSWGGVGLAGTVPRTPPPTWTPLPRTATPRPTAPQPPPTAPAATLAPQPDTWLGLHARYDTLAPGHGIELELTIHNSGGATLRGAVVSLPWPAELALVDWRAEQGEVLLEGTTLAWRPGDLGAGATSRLIITAEGGQDLLPGARLTLMASVEWESQARQSNPILLAAPPAVLPATGGG